MIDDIRRKFAQNKFEFSRHAFDRATVRRINVREIREAIIGGEIIEHYPEDKYGPTCLVLGVTRAGRALHIQCSYPSPPIIKIVTLYEPDPNEWIDFKYRQV